MTGQKSSAQARSRNRAEFRGRKIKLWLLCPQCRLICKQAIAPGSEPASTLPLSCVSGILPAWTPPPLPSSGHWLLPGRPRSACRIGRLRSWPLRHGVSTLQTGCWTRETPTLRSALVIIFTGSIAVLFARSRSPPPSSLALVLHSMPFAARERNSVLAAAALAYFTSVHSPWRVTEPKFRFPKEFLVGILFTMACAAPP